jgi:hypothetical protein
MGDLAVHPVDKYFGLRLGLGLDDLGPIEIEQPFYSGETEVSSQ